MARVKRSVIAERQMSMLMYLGGQASRCGRPFAQLSLRSICLALGLSKNQVRLALKALSETGLVHVEPRILPNGGTAENAYFITARGAYVLASHSRGVSASPRESL